jgi:uncharacterized membrane protein YkvA (DUF1232 family)
VSENLRAMTRGVAREALVLWLVARDRRSPWLARLVCAAAAAYVFSPVQLLPDFIPIVGCLDDLLVAALAGWFAVKLMPRGLMAELRARAEQLSEQPANRAAVIAITTTWIAVAALSGGLVWYAIAPPSARPTGALHAGAHPRARHLTQSQAVAATIRRNVR